MSISFWITDKDGNNAEFGEESSTGVWQPNMGASNASKVIAWVKGMSDPETGFDPYLVEDNDLVPADLAPEFALMRAQEEDAKDTNPWNDEAWKWRTKGVIELCIDAASRGKIVRFG